MREVIVAFRVTVPEREELKRKASETNQSISDLIRSRLLS